MRHVADPGHGDELTVLKLGRGSAYARWFDIDWSVGRIRLPVLGDDFEPEQLEIADGELRYFEHRFPVDPGTYALILGHRTEELQEALGADDPALSDPARTMKNLPARGHSSDSSSSV